MLRRRSNGRRRRRHRRHRRRRSPRRHHRKRHVTLRDRAMTVEESALEDVHLNDDDDDDKSDDEATMKDDVDEPNSSEKQPSGEPAAAARNSPIEVCALLSLFSTRRMLQPAAAPVASSSPAPPPTTAIAAELAAVGPTTTIYSNIEVTGFSLQWRSICDAQESARQERAIAKSNVARRRRQVSFLRFLFLRFARSLVVANVKFFDMEYEYRELGGVWDAQRLRGLVQSELSALAFEYEFNGTGSVSAFLQYS